MFRVRCSCGELYAADRYKVLNSRRDNRTLFCYDCVCRNRAKVSRAITPLRKRGCAGRLAKGKINEQ